jgi:hypothetical protein
MELVMDSNAPGGYRIRARQGGKDRYGRIFNDLSDALECQQIVEYYCDVLPNGETSPALPCWIEPIKFGDFIGYYTDGGTLMHTKGGQPFNI